MAKKMGRPKIPDDERKTNVLRIRLTAEERGLIDMAAASEEAESSTWARARLIDLAKKNLAKPK